MEQEVEQLRTIIGTMREHTEQCRALVGKDFALITVRRYESCTRYLSELIKPKYKKRGFAYYGGKHRICASL